MNFISSPVPLALASHQHNASRTVRGVNAVVDTTQGDFLTLAFVLECNPSALCLPESRAPRRADGLWRGTCFEAFVMADNGPGYREFNFSPSGEWAVYAFRGYRDGGMLEVELAPGIVVRRTMNRLELDAKIHQDFLPPGRQLQMGLSAVVEDADGKLSYWALRHPPGKPDFHHTDAFVLQLVLS